MKFILFFYFFFNFINFFIFFIFQNEKQNLRFDSFSDIFCQRSEASSPYRRFGVLPSVAKQRGVAPYLRCCFYCALRSNPLKYLKDILKRGCFAGASTAGKQLSPSIICVNPLVFLGSFNIVIAWCTPFLALKPKLQFIC